MTVELRCIRCGAAGDATLGRPCPACAAEGVAVNLATVYDLERAGREFAAALDGPLRGLPRYAALLPVAADEIFSRDVGDTPLFEVPRLAAAVGVARLWIKDESRGPTWSFKDRAAAIAAAHARATGAPALVVASTGNAAAAAAAHALRAGLPAVVLFARNVDPVMAAFVRAYPAQIAVTATKGDRWRAMRECVDRLGCYPASNYWDPAIGNNPYAVDGYKAIGFEIWEQLGRRAPDAVALPVCYGDGLYGVGRAFEELHALRLAPRVPRLLGGEVHGSLERALLKGADRVAPAGDGRSTAATSISAAQSTYQALHAVRRSDGWVSQVSEEAMLEAERLLLRDAGLYVERSSAAALACVIRQLEDGRLDRGAEVVLVNSSGGLKSVGLRLDAPAAAIEDVEAVVERAGELLATTARP